MKKLALAAVAAATMISTPAFADTTVIYANVPLVCNVDGPESNGGVNLNGTTALGDITAQCNNAAGFTFSITSLNGFKLKDQDNGANATTYAYSLAIAGVPGSFTSNQSFNSNALGANAALITPQSAAVSVTTSGPTGAAYAGTYQDTITWTISAN
ncbi:MAG: hypothetical protein JNM03_02580 [Sphingopyxis sp.]|uniref:hypothetical protein n=1 Tax=Sphingopyxis sp. TaxID=1908224 RepID=UPI001A3B0056|nr:hypothetical protein [Sphingopyxis sp.]MBL9068860.1 hypothetical protein [Sphingopyxis sp.]